MVNILVFDVIFLDTYGALASATIYTLLLFVILYCNRERTIVAVRALVGTAQPGRMPQAYTVAVVITALVMMGLLFAVDQALVNFFGHGRG